MIRIVKLYKNANYVLHENERKDNIPDIKEDNKLERTKSELMLENSVKNIGTRSNKVFPNNLKRGSVASENILGQISHSNFQDESSVLYLPMRKKDDIKLTYKDNAENGSLALLTE